MKVIPAELEGTYLITPPRFSDERGLFIKTLHFDVFEKHGLCADFKESFYSVSHKGVIRGMHFQVPPYDHAKLIYVPHGKVLDVVIDVRKKSSCFGRFMSVELSDVNCQILYIPKGFAHGFSSLEDNTVVVYLQTTVYSPEHDQGIRWDSFGMDWGISSPIVSPRDSQFPSMQEYTSPF